MWEHRHHFSKPKFYQDKISSRTSRNREFVRSPVRYKEYSSQEEVRYDSFTGKRITTKRVKEDLNPDQSENINFTPRHKERNISNYLKNKAIGAALKKRNRAGSKSF